MKLEAIFNFESLIFKILQHNIEGFSVTTVSHKTIKQQGYP